MDAIDLTFTDDLVISDGDLEICYSDDQHVEHILKANPGQFYQYPKVGYGVIKKLNASIDSQAERKLIKQCLEYDNYNMPLNGIVINQDTGVFHVQNYTRNY